MSETSSSTSDSDRAGLSQFADALANGDWRGWLGAFLLLTVFFLLTAAGNAGETDDVYAFAYRAENFALDYISDPRLMLYHMAMRLLYLAGQATGLDIAALTLMRGFSALCAAASLLVLLRIFVADLKLSPETALLATVVLGISYGFWRYAAEAEVYIPAILLILLVFHGLSRGHEKAEGFLSGMAGFGALGALAGLAVLFYQPSVIPLFFAFPCLLLYRDRVLQLGCYLAVGGAFVIAGYLLGFMAYWPDPLSLSSFKAFLSQRAGEFVVPPFSPKTVIVSMIRSAFALSHDLASVNWIFAFDPVVKLIQQAFAHNVITEEVFLARRAGAVVYLPIVTLAGLAFLALRLLMAAGWPSLTMLRQRAFLVILIWTAINGAIIGRLNPAGLEAWIMVFPPLVMLFAFLLVEPCVRAGRGRLVTAFAGVLFLHNAVGGMALVWDSENEYDRVAGAWIIAEAQPEDLVIVNGNAGLGESLRYLSPAQVALIGVFQEPRVSASLLAGDLGALETRTKGRDFSDRLLRDLISDTWRRGGRLIFLESFFQLPDNIKTENWPEYGLVAEFRERLQKVHDAGVSDAGEPKLGATYVMPPQQGRQNGDELPPGLPTPIE